MKLENFNIEKLNGKSRCPICGKMFQPLGLSSHFYRKHVDGYNDVLSEKISHSSWNKGKTKHTDTRILESSKKCSQTSTGKKLKPLTEEHREKISKSMKQYLENNPSEVPYLKNHNSKISYPEQYFLECFRDFSNIKFQHSVHRYRLDFANVKEKIYFEVDGEQHYVDRRIVEHDVKRNGILEKLGWTGIRVRWSHFIKLNDNQRKAEIERIIKELRGCICHSEKQEE